jgi:hypothetical protein
MEGKMYGLSGPDLRRSRITFRSSHGFADAADFRYLERAREPVSRSKAGVQGKVADVFSGRSRHAESQNELRAFQVLLATGRTNDWQEQPFHLDYHLDGARHRYTPDILVAWGSHREVVEIKDDAEADLPANQERFALIRELLDEHGYHFRVWRKAEICAEPRFSNVAVILRYRCVQVAPIEREKIRRAFASTSRHCLRTLCELHQIPIQSVLRTVLDGTLHVNWWEPVTLDSEVSCTPTGPQVWPSPQQGAQSPNCAGSGDVAFRI